MKYILINITKNAVNAALVALGPIATWHSQFNFSSLSGLEHIGSVLASAIVSRELLVYVPKILKWSQTNGDASQ